MKKRGISGISSLLVSLPCLGIFLSITIIASILHQALVAGFCLFVFLVCGFSRLWAKFSIRNVLVEISARSKHMFVGDDAEVSFNIRNEKMLPLIWLELLLPMPRRSCFMPSEDFEVSEVAFTAGDAWDGGLALQKRFSFIMSKDALAWTGRWSAKKRGVYRIDSLVLRSGDGFGLTQSQTVTTPMEMPVFVVYPNIRKVDITPFLSMQWDGTGGQFGFIDDLTIMRGMRHYEAGDSWKHINWRMAARQQGININLYETITPKAIHFVLDGESFCTVSGDDSEFEETISFLASLLLRLTEANVLCGLSLPSSKYMKQTDIAATSEVEELLTALADYDLIAKRDEEVSTAQDVVFMPSDFDVPALVRAARPAGRMYYIAHDAKALRKQGFPAELDKTKLIMLSYDEVTDEDAYALGVKCLRMHSYGGQ